MVGFGIDFGTTNSVAAAFDGRRVTPFVDSNNLPHPSVVWYNKDFPKPVIGRGAKEKIKVYGKTPGNVFIKSVKSKLEKEESFEIFGKYHTACEVASEIFRFLKEDIQTRETDDELTEAVVTVPLDFTGKQRQKIRSAAEKVGIAIKTFIHEPFAAVVGCLLKDSSKLPSLEPENILVFDWGGGTLDITLVKLDSGGLYELSHWGSRAGESVKSGDDFDALLMAEVIDQFRNESNISSSGFRLDPGNESLLASEVEFAKIDLSEEESVSLGIPDFYLSNGKTYTLSQNIKRSQFESLIYRDIQEAMSRVKSVLENAHLQSSQVNRVLLIGGTSRIPLLIQEMYKMFGVTKVVEIPNSNTVIAEGAAIISHHNWKPELVRPICIQLSDDSYYTVFDRRTILDPSSARKEVDFFCTDNRDGEARLIITENQVGKQQVKEILNIPVSRVLKDIYKERVRVDFYVDGDVVLKINAKAYVKNEPSSTEIHDLYYGLRFS